MSGGPACSCPERQRPIKERRWVVTDRNCNHSAFSGYQQTPSDYSEVWCLACQAHWRTTARYVDELRDDRGDVHRALYGEQDTEGGDHGTSQAR